MVHFNKVLSVALVSAVVLASHAQAGIYITEWMYNPTSAGGEFIEFTNIGPNPINMTGWSFDDDSRTPATVDLSSFGTLAPGESVILSESPEADFRAAWSLDPTVKIIGANTTNLGRNDEINLFNPAGILIDRLTYGDQNFPGTIRTQDISGNPTSRPTLFQDTISTAWVLSALGDDFGSYTSSDALTANPGSYVPEPASFALAGLGAIILLRRRLTR